MRNSRSKNFVLILIWTFIGALAAFFLYTASQNGGISFEPKYTGEPTFTLSDVTLDKSITSVSIDWITGGVKIIPTTDDHIRIVERAYKDIAKDKQLSLGLSGDALSIVSKNKTVFYFFGLTTSPTYLEVYLPITTSLNSFKLDGVSGSYSVDEIYSELTQINLTSGSLDFKNSYSSLLSLTMTSGSATFRDTQILTASIKMTSGKLDYVADTNNISLTMTSGLADLEFGSTNPSSFKLTMTSGSSNIRLNGPEAFSVTVDKTSGNFNPSFEYQKNDKTYTYKSGGPAYTISMTSGNVDFTVAP